MAEASPGDHGDADAGDACGCGMGESSGAERGGDEQRGFVADASSRVLVDSEGVEGSGVEGLAGETHGGSEGGEFAVVEAALEDGHEEGGDLGVGNFIRESLAAGSVVDDGTDEGLNLGVGQVEAVSLVEDDVDGMNMGLSGLCHFVKKKAAGKSSVMVASSKVPSSFGKKTMVSGALNSRIVWRQAPQGWLAELLRLAIAMARMRMDGP